VGLIARDAASQPGTVGAAGLRERLSRPGAGLLLDLDGTLVDSEPVHRGAYREYFAGRGWQVGEQVIGEFSGRRAAEVFAELEGPWNGEDPVALTEGVLEALRGTPLQPVAVAGAAQLIAACRRSGLPVAIVTSARRGWATTALDLFGVGDEGIAELGIRMVTAEDCALGKPDPEPYRRAARLLGLEPGDLVAAEDAPAGIASALGAGIGHVIVMTTSQPASVLRAAGAHSTAPDLVALAGVVEELET
jgi:sugar-phosphatase